MRKKKRRSPGGVRLQERKSFSEMRNELDIGSIAYSMFALRVTLKELIVEVSLVDSWRRWHWNAKEVFINFRMRAINQRNSSTLRIYYYFVFSK